MYQDLFDLLLRLKFHATPTELEEIVQLIQKTYTPEHLNVPRSLLETLLEDAISEYNTMHSQCLNWEVLKIQQKAIEDTKAILEKESIK